ncbi:MAG: hypothetical protein LBC74_10555 [Planctomycetaceae bacterium]|jgi:hypothetical protein|nr:hypothetical protein [Planctomycetaceae bacterium]
MTNFIFPINQQYKNNLLAGLVFFCAIAAISVVGCQSLPRSGIDRSGDRLFDSCPLQDVLPKDCRLFGQGQNQNSTASSPVSIPNSTPSSAPANLPSTPSLSTSMPSSNLPGNFGSSSAGTSTIPNYGSTSTAVNPNIHGVNTAVVPVENANGLRPCFEESGGYVVATGAIERPALLVSPIEQIAPVGSEVVLIASYLGRRDRLVTNEKVEWNLEGVGSFLKYDQGSHCDPLMGDFVKARKITERFVVTKTSRFFQTLNRGTPETRDDLHILQGQTWVSINSLREGTTHVTAFAPSLSDWSRRTMFGLIHWVDAQWVMPVLPIASVGESRVLTTSVLRRTNGQPRQGWIVRYEIVSGPAAGLGATMAQIQEVTTDISGQASVILSQREPQNGTNTISVQIIRPGSGVGGQDSVAAGDKRITVGYETLRQTWGGNAGVRVSMKGPERGNIGEDLPYKIIVTNNTANKAEGVLTLSIPPVAGYVRSVPPIYSQTGQILYWNVEIPAKSSANVDVVLRQGVSGRMMLGTSFTPNGKVNITGEMTTGGSNLSSGTNPVYPNTGSLPRDAASVAPVLPSGVSGNATKLGDTASTWGDAVTLPGAPTNNNTNPIVDTGGKFDHLQLGIIVNPNTVLKVDKEFEILLTLENKGTVDVGDVALRIPIPLELRNLEKYNFKGPRELRDNRTIEIDRNSFNILQKVGVIGAGKSVTMQIGFPKLLPAGYSVVGELLINNKLVKRTPPLRVKADQ